MRLLAERHSADLAAAGSRPMRPNFCFAPGTPESYMRSVAAASGGVGKHFRLADEPRHWEFTATDGQNIPRGDAITLTWSIVPDGTHIPEFKAGNGSAANSDLRARLNALYGNEATWMALFQQVFDRWQELTGITYVHEPNDDMAAFSNVALTAPGVLGVRADVRIGGRPIDGDSMTLAFNFDAPNGEMVIDTLDNAFEDMANNSLLFRNTVSHEHGHGLGIKHVCPIDNTKLMEPFVSENFDGPQHDDILAGQRQHGDPMENNDTFAQATNLGVVSDGAVTLNTVLNGAFLSLDGSDDVDIFKFNVAAAGRTASLTLRPIGQTYLEGPQIDQICSEGTLFNSLTVKNLGIELISSDASMVLATADLNGPGQSETIATIPLPGGTGPFFVRVFGGAVDSVQLYEVDLTVATGSSGALDHFDFAAIASPKAVNQSFPVTLNAEDIFNGPAAGFSGTVSLSLLASESILISEIDPGTTDRVEFCNVSERTVDVSGWQIVVYDASSGATPSSTTTLAAFSSIAPGGVFGLTEDGVAPGALPNLFSGSAIDWSHNSGAISVLLLDAGGGIVDFATLGDSSAFSNPAAIPVSEWSGPGISESGSDTYQRTGSGDSSIASDWSPVAQSFGSRNTGLTFPFPERSIGFSPTTTGAFSSGVRMETLTFTEPGTGVVIKADDGSGHVGYSAPFDLELVDDISVVVTAVPSSVRKGETITYTATIQNTGPSGATSVTLTDMLPANTAFVSAFSSQGSVGHDAGSPGTVTANLGALAGGLSATVTINITSSATGTLINTVGVARGETDSFAPNNAASATVNVVDGPDNVEEFNAFTGFSGSFSGNPSVANDTGSDFSFLNFGSGGTTTATGFGLDATMSQNGRGLAIESDEGSGMQNAADISPSDYTVNSHMIAFWFKFTEIDADGPPHATSVITVFNQNAPDNGDYSYRFAAGLNINSITVVGMTRTTNKVQGVGLTLPRANGGNTTYPFTSVAPNVWHQAILHYTSASGTTVEDGSLSVWIDPAGGADAPDLVFNSAGDALTARKVGPFGKYGFGQVTFGADALGPDVFIDSIGTWNGIGMAGVNDLQAGVDFLNSSIPNLAIAAVSASKAEGDSGSTAFDFTLTRTGPNAVATTVNFAVAGTGANSANAADFGGELPSGSVSFAAGETSKAVTINVSGDGTAELDEEFTVTISVPGGGVVINAPSATGTIQNDDQEFDFGDAPDPGYPTLLASDGARHALSGPFLGASRDVDADGQPNSEATGDDLNMMDDEDGVTFATVLRAGDNANVTVSASASGGRLSAWIDFDGDGSWSDPGEQVITDAVLAAGSNELSFVVASNAAIGDTFARFRLSTQAGLTSLGFAPDGEVEDYKVAIVMNAVPVADAGSDMTPVVGQTVSLSGMGTDADNGDTLSFAWDFDFDGETFNADAATQNTMTAYASPGVRTVALRVSDQLGASHVDTAMVTVSKAATSTAILSDDPDHSDSGQSVTITAQVTVDAPGAGAPTGMVEFFEGANSLGQGALSVGMASLATTQLPGGTLSLTAQYLGDANFAGSVSDPEAHVVNRAPTASASGPAMSVVGETISFTGMGSDPDDGDMLSFAWDFDFDGANFTADATTQNAMTTYSSPGVRTVALRVTDQLGASDINTLMVTVNKAATSTAILSDNPDPSDSGQSVTITAQVTVDAPGAGAPTGMVEFFEGANSLGQGALSDGMASLATTQLPGGTSSLTAQYLGDVNFAGSVSDPEAHAVNRAPNASASVPAMSVVGETISFTGMGSDPDDGDMLSFAWDFDFDGENFTADATTQNAMTTYLSPGVRVVALRVTDDLGASDINTAMVTVNKADTATTLSSSPTSSNFGQQVTLTATIAALPPGMGTPTGVVIFKEGANTLGMAALNGSGEATLDTSALPAGDLSLTVEYLGDANTNPSESQSVSHTVNALLDFGDAPDPLASTAGQYSTLLANDGARHRIIDGAPRLGAEIDAEADGQPDANALGDNEDGVMIPPLVRGTTAGIQVEVTVAAGKLDAWIDFNQNGVWESPAEQIAVSMTVGVGMHTLMVPVNQSTLTGPTFARFRISSQGSMTPAGEALDGEVEDCRLIVSAATPPRVNNISMPKPDASGNVDVVFVGTPGVFYQLQASSDLQMWTTLATVQADANGVVFHSELGVGSLPGRFYRVFQSSDD